MAIAWPIPELLPVISTFLPRIPCIIGLLWTLLGMNIDNRRDGELGFAYLTHVGALAARGERKCAVRPDRPTGSSPTTGAADNGVDLGEIASACGLEDNRVLRHQIATGSVDQVVASQNHDGGGGRIYG